MVGTGALWMFTKAGGTKQHLGATTGSQTLCTRTVPSPVPASPLVEHTALHCPGLPALAAWFLRKGHLLQTHVQLYFTLEVCYTLQFDLPPQRDLFVPLQTRLDHREEPCALA